MPSVGLVLGAGGFAGHAFHVGTLEAVQDELDWDARDAAVIVGTSAGAGVGSLLRAGLSVADLRARLEGRTMSAASEVLVEGSAGAVAPFPPFRWPSNRQPAAPSLLWSGFTRPWRSRPGLLLAGALPAGTVPTTSISDLHDYLHRGRRWPDRPLWINAVRLRDGTHVVLGRDLFPEPSVGIAVAASSAIPGYFAPVTIDDERYVDGGAHSPTNAQLVGDLELDVVIVSSPMSARPHPDMVSATGWNPRLVGRPYHHLRLRQELAALRRRARDARLMVFEPTPADLRAMGMSAMRDVPMGAIAASAHASATAALEARRPAA